MVSNSLPSRNKIIPRQNRLLATCPTTILLHTTRHDMHLDRDTFLARYSSHSCHCLHMDRLRRVRRLEECDGFQHATSALNLGCRPANPRLHPNDNLDARHLCYSPFRSVPTSHQLALQNTSSNHHKRLLPQLPILC